MVFYWQNSEFLNDHEHFLAVNRQRILEVVADRAKPHIFADFLNFLGEQLLMSLDKLNYLAVNHLLIAELFPSCTV